MSDRPIDLHEADLLFAPFAREAARPCALGVSGGADSTALMVLFRDWLQQKNGDPSQHAVITIDHGLRAASASEARGVAAHATRLGFRHETLVWSGPHPETGIQQAARDARYRLIAEYMSANGIVGLFSAHTLDDQAETVLMRLARGSGLDGLAAMAPVAPLPCTAELHRSAEPDLRVLRPLLDVPKARLVATLRSRGIGWINDPTNEATEFERTRLRAAQGELVRLGLTPEMLALSAARLRRVRDLLEATTAGFIAPESGSVSADRFGRVTIVQERLREAGTEIALRVLAKAVAAAGGAGDRPSLAKLEIIATALIDRERGASGAWTLSRAKIEADRGEVTVEREPGRTPLPVLALAPAMRAVWDGRFCVTALAATPYPSVDVRPLGEAALSRLRRDEPRVASVPFNLAALLPSFWNGDKLLAVPPLQHWSEPTNREIFRAEFLGFGQPDSDTSPC